MRAFLLIFLTVIAATQSACSGPFKPPETVTEADIKYLAQAPESVKKQMQERIAHCDKRVFCIVQTNIHSDEYRWYVRREKNADPSSALILAKVPLRKPDPNWWPASDAQCQLVTTFTHHRFCTNEFEPLQRATGHIVPLYQPAVRQNQSSIVHIGTGAPALLHQPSRSTYTHRRLVTRVNGVQLPQHVTQQLTGVGLSAPGAYKLNRAQVAVLRSNGLRYLLRR